MEDYGKDYKKIKYWTEDQTKTRRICFTLLGIILTIVLVLFILYGIQSVKDGGSFIPDMKNFRALLILLILFCGPLLTVGIRNKKDCSVYIKMREHFLEQGVKCAGVVNDVKVHELDTQLDEDVRKKKPLFSRYVYVVSYTDPEGQEKTTETYEVMHPDKEAAGKQCIVYTLDGKCFVDAIEKKTEGGNKHEEHGGNISADEG